MLPVSELTYRPSFRENKPKTLVFRHTKRAFWACFSHSHSKVSSKILNEKLLSMDYFLGNDTVPIRNISIFNSFPK
jgi:hypothetical protein